MRKYRWELIGLALLAFTAPVYAHTSLPAYLELNELAPGTFSVIWKVPTVEGPPPAISPVLPTQCVVPNDPSAEQIFGSVVTTGIVACGEGGLVGQTIEIDGLRVTIMDTVVRITFADGTSISQVLRPQSPSFIVRDSNVAAVDGWGYFRLGVDHILSGIDHLLFVFGLLLLIVGFRTLLKAVTAFTAAHSITLGLATLGLVQMPQAPIEALVALSIVFLAAELAQTHTGTGSLTFRKPWIMAFAFGLLHGFGFAGALSEIGIPSSDIPIALLSFNGGVEAGQVAFILVTLSLFYSLRLLGFHVKPWMRPIPAYAIGSCASLWFLQRCALIFG